MTTNVFYFAITETQNAMDKRHRIPNPKYFSDSDSDVSKGTPVVRKKITKKVEKNPFNIFRLFTSIYNSFVYSNLTRTYFYFLFFFTDGQ